MSEKEREFDKNITTESTADEVDADFARRIRVEVKHIKGEPTPTEGDEAEVGSVDSDNGVNNSAAQSKEQKNNIWEVLMSGRILLHKSVARYYSHLMLIAIMTFVSIFVMFWSLRVDMRHNARKHEVQLLREKSIRMRESSYARSSHSAIVRELERRGIDLRDARTPSMVIDD